jgi:hypothetical protein
VTKIKDNKPTSLTTATADGFCQWITYGREELLLMEAACAILENLVIPAEEKDQLLDAMGRADAAREHARLRRGPKYVGRFPQGTDLSDLVQRAVPREIYIQIHKQAIELLALTKGDIIHAAKMGDRRGVAKYLREGGHASREILAFLADVLEDETLRSANAPPQMKTRERHREIVWFVLTELANGARPDAAKNNAAEKFKLGKRRVQQIFKDHEDSEPPIFDAVKELQKALDDLLRELGV